MALSSPSPATTATARSGRLRLHRTDRQRRGEHADRRGAAAAGSDEATAVTAPTDPPDTDRGNSDAASDSAAGATELPNKIDTDEVTAANAALLPVSDAGDARADAPAPPAIPGDSDIGTDVPTGRLSDSGIGPPCRRCLRGGCRPHRTTFQLGRARCRPTRPTTTRRTRWPSWRCTCARSPRCCCVGRC